MHAFKFFKALRPFLPNNSIVAMDRFLCDKHYLRRFLYNDLNLHRSGNYLCDTYIEYLNNYAIQSPVQIRKYFSGQQDLNALCKDFIRFCFSKGIQMDKYKTIDSFKYHNGLSDSIVKKRLLELSRQNSINLLGFGLGGGEYESMLAQFLKDNGLASKVNLYGFDPYAKEIPGVQLLTPAQLSKGKLPKFNVIIARWVLHHVEFQRRWQDFIRCMNQCAPEGLVLVVEHGFLKQAPDPSYKQLYQLFNATFDVIANIGIRPQYFLSTYPKIGDDFFIHYLEDKDFESISQQSILKCSQIFYDCGPNFPNQTLYCLQPQRLSS